MKRTPSSIILFFLLAVFSIGTAAYAMDEIKRRIIEMQVRIDQGVKAGEINRPEERRLRNELNGILQEGIIMKRDGRLNRLEKARLNLKLDELSKHIFIESSDRDRKRPDAYPSGVHQRIVEMHRRIDQGVKSGEITRHEDRRLRAELNKIRDDEARMKADGRLSRREIDRLNAELDRLSRDINRERHDRDRRRR